MAGWRQALFIDNLNKLSGNEHKVSKILSTLNRLQGCSSYPIPNLVEHQLDSLMPP